MTLLKQHIFAEKGAIGHTQKAIASQIIIIITNVLMIIHQTKHILPNLDKIFLALCSSKDWVHPTQNYAWLNRIKFWCSSKVTIRNHSNWCWIVDDNGERLLQYRTILLAEFLNLVKTHNHNALGEGLSEKTFVKLNCQLW